MFGSSAFNDRLFQSLWANTAYLAVMKRYVLNLLFSVPFLALGQKAQEVITSSLEAMGGVEKWKEIQYIQSKQAGHKYWLEQSENPDGPYITSYEITTQTRAVYAKKSTQQTTTHQFVSGGLSEATTILNGDHAMMKFGTRAFPMPSFFKIVNDEKARYAPDYLLLTAMTENVSLLAETELSGTPHFVVSFTKDQLNHRLYINQYTKTLTEARIESHQPHSLYDYPWGKFVTTIKYSIYWMYEGGIRYPAQWDVFKLGKPYLSTTFIDLQFKTEVDEGQFAIPDSIKSIPQRPLLSVNETPFPTDGLIEVANGVNMIKGMWNVGTIIHKDGIFVIEGPISSGYNTRHLEWIGQQYPDLEIKGVITTSDAWPHVGGIREFIARGIPVYAYFLNEEIIRKVSDADHSLEPDLQQTAQKEPQFQLVESALEIDDPDVPIRLIPLNGEGGERMMAVYFPKQKLLYASDLIQYSGRKKTFFSPQYLSEVKVMVDKHQLEVETVFAMHLAPVPWQEILDALEGY